jgi:hypothetical protein
VVGGCSALAATFGVRVYHDYDGARTATNEFLSAVERGDGARAGDLLCRFARPDTVQRAMSLGISAHRVIGVSISSNFSDGTGAKKSADVTVDLTIDGGRHRRAVVEVVDYQDVWLVCAVL